MNRATFMAQLRAGLSGIHPAEVEDILADYENHFSDGIAHGRSEDDVAAALGDPARLARELRAETGFKRWEENRSAGNFLGVVLALLGLATLDLMILLPVLFALVVAFFAIGVTCLALMVAGSYLLANLLPVGWHHVISHNPGLQALAGAGLLSGGLGGGALLIMVTEWIAKMLIRYARLHFRLFDTAAQSI